MSQPTAHPNGTAMNATNELRNHTPTCTFYHAVMKMSRMPDIFDEKCPRCAFRIKHGDWPSVETQPVTTPQEEDKR